MQFECGTRILRVIHGRDACHSIKLHHYHQVRFVGATNNQSFSTVDLLARYLKPSYLVPANKKRGPNCAAPFSLVKWLRLLEVNPRPNFHLTRGVNRTRDPPKVRRSRKS